ncbi:MAG: peptide chain release factor N(5)-glutamine methyltransferase [Solirubrobacteraceae bacterium]
MKEALDGAITAFTAAGLETPRLDAELLVAHVLGVGREQLYTDRDLRVVGAQVRPLQQAVHRRAVQREPLPYITGVRGFRHIELCVDERVLIPRPETELLVQIALALPAGSRVLDLGTGSGAVALALAQERPDLSVAGSDISADALELARVNAERLGLEVDWLQADLLEGIADEFDVILSNPPYVAEGERACLAPEITRHEPPLALFAGSDGLAVIGPLIAQAAARSRLGTLAIEVGATQADAVARLMADAGFGAVSRHRDLAGIERVIVGAR